MVRTMFCVVQVRAILVAASSKKSAFSHCTLPAIAPRGSVLSLRVRIHGRRTLPPPSAGGLMIMGGSGATTKSSQLLPILMGACRLARVLVQQKLLG